jgi:hypothetical protein
MHTKHINLKYFNDLYYLMAQEISHGGFAVEPSSKFAMIHCTCCNRMIPGKVICWPDQAEPEKIPLWRPCKECGIWLSHLEEDDKSLKGRCFECHQEILL